MHQDDHMTENEIKQHKSISTWDAHSDYGIQEVKLIETKCPICDSYLVLFRIMKGDLVEGECSNQRCRAKVIVVMPHWVF